MCDEHNLDSAFRDRNRVVHVEGTILNETITNSNFKLIIVQMLIGIGADIFMCFDVHKSDVSIFIQSGLQQIRMLSSSFPILFNFMS